MLSLEIRQVNIFKLLKKSYLQQYIKISTLLVQENKNIFFIYATTQPKLTSRIWVSASLSIIEVRPLPLQS